MSWKSQHAPIYLITYLFQGVADGLAAMARRHQRHQHPCRWFLTGYWQRMCIQVACQWPLWKCDMKLSENIRRWPQVKFQAEGNVVNWIKIIMLAQPGPTRRKHPWPGLWKCDMKFKWKYLEVTSGEISSWGKCGQLDKKNHAYLVRAEKVAFKELVHMHVLVAIFL
jgi:hypothetical protein